MSRTGICFSSLLIVLLFAAGCSHSSRKRNKRAAQVEVSYDPHFPALSESARLQYRDSVKTFLNDKLDLGSFHGMVLVAKNGKIIFEQYLGWANEAEKLHFGPETPLHVASISKTVTSVAVLRLVDQGRVKLDVPVSNYLPRFPYKDITIRMLLSHRSGLPYYGYFPREMTGRRAMTNGRILRILKRYHPELNFPPGTRFAYCNTNYALLALVVEHVTGFSFPTAMQQLIFKPLKMVHTRIGGQGRMPDNHALSYNSRGVLQADMELDPVYGDKNLFTTVRDLLRFDSGTYCDSFLSREMKAEMFRGYSYEKPGKANYGLGIRIREVEGKTPYYFHTGWWHGNTGCYVTMRNDTTCMIMLSNHYSRKVFAIHALSPLFGNYPFGRTE